jgi:hypothetical protein
MVVNVGDQVSLTCVTQGDPTPVITWVKDDIRVTNGNRFVLQPSGELSIAEIGKNDEGNYQCVARNELGSAVKTVRVVVRGNANFYQWECLVLKKYSQHSANRILLIPVFVVV